MHILFVDESGTAPEPAHAEKSPKFVLGGISVTEDSWVELAKRLGSLKSAYKIAGEIKWRYFNRSNESNHATLSHLSIDQRNEFRKSLLNIIQVHAEGRVFVAVVDPASAYRSGFCYTADEMYEKAFRALTIEFSKYLIRETVDSKSIERGLVVADHRNPTQDAALRNAHHENFLLGKFESHQLVEGLFFSASHLSVGTQLADFIAGVSFRKYARGDEEF